MCLHLYQNRLEDPKKKRKYFSDVRSIQIFYIVNIDISFDYGDSRIFITDKNQLHGLRKKIFVIYIDCILIINNVSTILSCNLFSDDKEYL